MMEALMKYTVITFAADKKVPVTPVTVAKAVTVIYQNHDVLAFGKSRIRGVLGPTCDPKHGMPTGYPVIYIKKFGYTQL
jgi:hypothetical protein